MVKIYEKIGPWGRKWDFTDIQTWDGVTIALDLDTDEYRIVGFNYFGSFRGQFPEEFSQLTELRELGLGGGDMSGIIPPSIGNLKNLEILYVAYNNVGGGIPKELGSLSNLRKLTLGKNQITGRIPDEIGQLKNLYRLEIANTKVFGEIPKSLANLGNLKFLIIANCHISGTFPIEVLSSTRIIDCTYNNITSLPFEIWKDDNNSLLPDLQFNNINEEVPEWVKQTERWKSKKYVIENQIIN